MFDYCLIMAGGSGTRLWPASSSKMPKQFLPAEKNISFFFLALERALALGEKIIIISGRTHIAHVIKDAAKLTTAEKKRLIIIEEPSAKNTAAAIACAVVFVKRYMPQNANMLVLTSDHLIEPLRKFKSDAEEAMKAAAENKLVIFGIPPSRPETGYGYIEVKTQSFKNKNNLYKVAAFHEKPDLAAAKKYSSGKRFFWNSGMFVFNIGFIEERFQSLAPDIFRHFEKLRQPEKEAFTAVKGVKILSCWRGLENAYKKSSSVSFDCSITEKCKEIIMIRANFNWIDIGSWEEYINLRKKNNSPVFNAASDNCYVDSDIPVALAGAENLIIVIRGGKNGEPAAALIAKKGQTHLVKDIVEQIKIAGKIELL